MYKRMSYLWAGLAVLAALSGCRSAGPAALPPPQVFTAPAAELSAGLRLTRPVQAGDPWDHFGGAVDLAGDVLVAGATMFNRGTGEQPGAAFVFRQSAGGEWHAEAALSASDRADGFQYDQHFGAAVGVHGSLIAVGAPGADDPHAGDNTGAVYIFQHTAQGWVETHKLAVSQPLPGARLGNSLAFSGDLLAVGGAPEAGSVAIFQRQAAGWRQHAQIPVPASPDGQPYSLLLDLLGDTLAISAFSMQPPDLQAQAMQGLQRTGIVLIFERSGDTWQETYRSPPHTAFVPHIDQRAPLGIPVALGGRTGQATLLAVGKSGFTGSGREYGSVAVYTRTGRGWAPHAELMLAPGPLAPGALPFVDPQPAAVFFGAAVAMHGERLAVLSTFANSIYVFERQAGGWQYRFRLSPGPGITDDFQRRVVALDGPRLLLGSPGELGDGDLFLFDLD